MYYIYSEHIRTGKQDCCGGYRTKKEAVRKVVYLYALDAFLEQAGEYYYFISKDE